MLVEIKVTGIVQGVGFRPFVYRVAIRNSLVGQVRNLGDATVEIIVEGEKNKIDSFLSDLEKKKPPLAQIYEINTTELRGKNEFTNRILSLQEQMKEDPVIKKMIETYKSKTQTANQPTSPK